MSSWALAALLIGVVVGAAALGHRTGRRVGHREAHLRDPIVAGQGAVLGFVGLVLRSACSWPSGATKCAGRPRWPRRTPSSRPTYLRSQTLAEPVRIGSLDRLVHYTDSSIRLSHVVPTSARADDAIAGGRRPGGSVTAGRITRPGG